jgi:hypothetical protein
MSTAYGFHKRYSNRLEPRTADRAIECHARPAAHAATLPSGIETKDEDQHA